MNRGIVSSLFVFGLACLGCTSEPVSEPVRAQALQEMTNSIGMKLVLIPKGTFKMGASSSEEGSTYQYEVTISQDYYLGVYEVTQAQYEKVMGGNPGRFQGDKVEGDSSNHPVEQVSWEDAVEFCKRLSELPAEKAAGRVYRLPTEAEWEYGCRAGSTTAYSFGDSARSLGDYAWFSDNSGKKPHAVGGKKPNAWGLYDMHGNVSEWCADWIGVGSMEPVTDPNGPAEGPIRMYRGGGWFNDAANCRSAYRVTGIPSLRTLDSGFRLALSSSGIPK